MRKLQLDVDALEVESFVTADAGAEAGTVHGRAVSGGCLKTLYHNQCISLTGDLECQCADTAAVQHTCEALCATDGCLDTVYHLQCISLTGDLECQCA